MPTALERIDLRTSVETKALIARAAAQAVLNQTDSLTLTPRDWEAFVTALDHLDQPRPKLSAAMERYRAWRSQQTDV